MVYYDMAYNSQIKSNKVLMHTTTQIKTGNLF